MPFQTALSGLNAAQTNLSVTGHNIANASTIGFKRSRAEFADVYATSFTTTSQVGSGVRVASVTQQFAQGNIEFTDNSLDLAISGDGFFIIRDPDGAEFYTRAGAFQINKDGYVVNSKGQFLIGYPFEEGVAQSSQLDSLQVSSEMSEASPTRNTTININLSADAIAITDTNRDAIDDILDELDPPPAALEDFPLAPADPNSYNFSTSTTVYDSLGKPHTQTFYFVRNEVDDPDTDNPNSWTVLMALGGRVIAAEQLEFGADGRIDGASEIFSDVIYLRQPEAEDLELSVNLGDSTQFSGSSVVNMLRQDGFPTGRISGIVIENNGEVFARYTNGESKILGSVSVARFENVNGLQPVGDTNWAATFESGARTVGVPGTGAYGQIQSGGLESSNVDLSAQLVNMIIAQRDFQANAKMISTADQMTQTVINIR